MMNHQYAPSGSADSQQKVPASPVDLFLLDLKNEAIEHGLKTGGFWNLQIADEITCLKRRHYPIISLRLQPRPLLQAYTLVKGKLKQSLSRKRGRAHRLRSDH